MTPQALKRAIADLIDDFCVLNKTVSELREHNNYLESRVSEESDHAALLARHNALVEAVAWERECGTVSFTDLWLDEWNRTEDQSKSAMQELRFTRRAARAEVDRLIANADDCEGEG